MANIARAVQRLDAPSEAIGLPTPAVSSEKPRKRVHEDGASAAARPSPPKRSRAVTFLDVKHQLSGLQKLIDACRADLKEFVSRKISLDTGEIIDELTSSKEEALLAQQSKIEAKVEEIRQLQRQKEDLEIEIKSEPARATRATTSRRRTQPKRAPAKRTPAPKPARTRRISAEENYRIWFNAYHGFSLS